MRSIKNVKLRWLDGLVALDVEPFDIVQISKQNVSLAARRRRPTYLGEFVWVSRLMPLVLQASIFCCAMTMRSA